MQQILPYINKKSGGIDLENGLVGHWLLDDSGTNILDQKGQYDLTYNGLLNQQPFIDSTNTALGFDIDIAQRELFPAEDLLLINTDNSFSFWIYIESVSTAPRIISRSTGSGIGGFEILMFAGNIHLYINGSSKINTPIPILNTWHHLVFTNTDLGSKIYLNGLEVSTDTRNNRITSDAEKTFSIGRLATNISSIYALDGILARLRVYNRALSNLEVLELFNSQI